jgi:hypothetical protein
MNIILDVAKELFGMFLADARLTTATLVLVAIVAVIVAMRIEPLVGGALLLVGCLAILVEAAVRETRRRHMG